MQRYTTNPQAIHETIDGETIIIDLATGTYFSLLGAAPTIWNALAEGASTDEIVAQLGSVYEPNGTDLSAAVEEFLRTLEGEQLIAPGGEPAAPPSEPVAPAAGERMPFQAPKLEKYTDMQDIILLDPVHEVDSRGWPHAAESQAG
jgi:hypothetical protein